MLIEQNPDFSVCVLPLDAPTVNYFSLSEYKEIKNQCTRVGLTAAGALFESYYLEKYRALPPQARILADEKGKPYLPDYPDFTFSISHSGELAAAVWGRGKPVGIDLQTVSPYALRVAERCFPENEVEELAGYSGDRDRLFIRRWTEYEAVLKAVGTGLFGFRKEDYVQIKKKARIFDLSKSVPESYILTVALLP